MNSTSARSTSAKFGAFFDAFAWAAVFPGRWVSALRHDINPLKEEREHLQGCRGALKIIHAAGMTAACLGLYYGSRYGVHLAAKALHHFGL